MRIAYLSNNNPENIHLWSGTPYHIIQILKEKHTVIWIGGNVISGAKWHHTLKNKLNIFHPESYSKEIGLYLSKEIENNKCDIVITSTYFFVSNLAIDIPIIYFADVTLNLCKDFFRIKPESYVELAYQIEKLCTNNADAVIYSSEWAKKSAIDEYSLPPEKVHVVEFGANIPDPIIDSKMSCFEKDRCNLLFVGRNWKNKGGQVALETYYHIQKTLPNCRLTIVGCKPSVEIEDPNIIVYPWLDKSKKEDLKIYEKVLKESNFLLLPTVFDAYGIVLCEASAYGVPSLVANVGGVSQVIKNGVNGFLLPKDSDAKQYAHQILRLYNNPKEYIQLRSTSRKEYLERLNWDIWSLKVNDIMEKIVTQKKDKHQNITDNFYIPVYAFNLKSRKDRLLHLKQQFEEKEIFKVKYIESHKHPIGAVGLWNNITNAVKLAKQNNDEIIILCEDDHEFTSAYNEQYLLQNIALAYKQGADILNGGISGFGTAVPVSQNLFWIDWFWCTQFVVIYKSLFDRILEYEFRDTDVADLVLSRLTNNKLTMFPPVSTQHNFGYSDISPENMKDPHFIDKIFQQGNMRLKVIYEINKKYTSSETH